MHTPENGGWPRDFVTEKYADQISAILAQWSSDLLQSPQDLSAIEKFFCQPFSDLLCGQVTPSCGVRVEDRGPSQYIHPGDCARRRRVLAGTAVCHGRLFEDSYAEFQVTSIDAASIAVGAAISRSTADSQSDMNWVATGHDFYANNAWVYWQLTWEQSASVSSALRTGLATV